MLGLTIKGKKGILRKYRDSNSEVGMRPPAHRGLRLRPGGKAESKVRSIEHGAKGMGKMLGSCEAGKVIAKRAQS
jgi:hypothetical protein